MLQRADKAVVHGLLGETLVAQHPHGDAEKRAVALAIEAFDLSRAVGSRSHPHFSQTSMGQKLTVTRTHQARL
jgi:hypothetical protein